MSPGTITLNLAEAGIRMGSTIQPKMNTLLCGQRMILTVFCVLLVIPFGSKLGLAADSDAVAGRRLLYVATPGIRNYLEYGGTAFWSSTSTGDIGSCGASRRPGWMRRASR